MYLLITGASGHIGSAIAKECNKRKIKTILLTRSNKKKIQLKRMFNNCVVKTINSLKKKDHISFVIHTASLNDKESNKSKNSVKISLDITKKIFSKINIQNLKKIIYLSTAQVYGANLSNFVDEKTKLKPINNYGISRVFNEKFLEKLAIKNKLNLSIVRISNVVGEPIVYNKKCLRLLPNDIKHQARKFKIIKLKSSGLQLRNFVSLENTTRTLIELIKLKEYGVQKLNLGGINTSVLSFVKKFIYFYEKKNKKKIKLYIENNTPKKVSKLNYTDFKLRKLLKRKYRKETLELIVKKFLKT